MLWDTTLAANIGYIAALFYNQNNVASMASGVTLQLEREVRKKKQLIFNPHPLPLKFELN